MKTILIACAAFLFLLSAPSPAPAAAAAAAAGAAGIEWHKDFDKARSLAKELGKPMLIEYAAEWCPPCKEMERSFWPKPQTVELAKKFVCVRLDFDRRGPEVATYKVDAIPAVVFADSWGNSLAVKIGFRFQDSPMLLQLMQAMPEDFSPINEWNSILERDRENYNALAKVGGFYLSRNAPDLSLLYFKRALKTKGIEADPTVRENVLIAIGISQLRQRDYEGAKKSFESYLKEVPGGSHSGTAYVGILTSLLNRKKFDEAQKTLEQLKAAHAGSPLISQAEELFRQARSSKQ